MAQRVDYYALLSRAVEQLAPDAYAARGAIYDREHKALLKRLISSSAPCTDADIAREERAFRDAIRRIEFPDERVHEQGQARVQERGQDRLQERVQAPRTPQREPEASWPSSSREKARALRREVAPEPARDPERAAPRAAKRRWWDAGPKEARREPVGRPIVPPPEEEEIEPDWDHKGPKSGSLVGLVARYLLIAAVVLGAGALGYAYVVGAFDLSWLNVRGQAAPPSQRAILSPVEAGQSGTPSEGKVVWRTRTEANGPSGQSDTVVALDVEIPEPHLALAISLSRVTDAGAGMSHLLEIRFARPEELPFGGIARITNIAMKGTQTDAGESLVGSSINIAPGQFMFGLLGVPDVVQQNVQRLRMQNWLDLLLLFGNGTAYTLSIEKGAGGQRAIDEALAKWGQ
jgi:hypothetical protein